MLSWSRTGNENNKRGENANTEGRSAEEQEVKLQMKGETFPVERRNIHDHNHPLCLCLKATETQLTCKAFHYSLGLKQAEVHNS